MTRGQRNIKWIEQHCVIPEGKFVGQRVKLTKKQKQWLRAIYDSPTRTFILSIARKNAKTTFIAFLLLLHLCGPEARPNSQLYSAAQSRDQAAIVFGLAAKMVRMSEDLSGAVNIRDTAKQLYCEPLGTLYKALSADAATAYGLSPVFIVHDELGQVKGPRSELYEALETASAAHDDPLSVIISTQAPTDADLLSVLIDDALTGSDKKVKVELYTAPIEDDPFTLSTIRKANPHLDVFMNKQEVLRMADEAKRMPSRESSYRNLILNQRVEVNSPFVSKMTWQRNGDIQVERSGRDMYCGLDLSAVNDLTAFVAIADDKDGKFSVFPTFWLPGSNIVEKSRTDRVPYDLWAREGHLQLTPGESIEYEWVAYRLREFFRDNKVKALAFDRYNMKFLKPWLEKAGFSKAEIEEKFIDFGQGYLGMSPALRELESLMLNGRLRHGNHPVLTMCAANATVVMDPAGNRKLDKNPKKRTGRIDGMVALAMAVGVLPEQTEPKGPSVYQERGIRTL